MKSIPVTGVDAGETVRVYNRSGQLVGEFEAAAPNDLDSKFARFHAANPHVYARLVKLARRSRKLGRKQLSVKMLWEVARWQIATGRKSSRHQDEPLNNSFHSRYARLIMAQEPDLAGVFETRRLRS